MPSLSAPDTPVEILILGTADWNQAIATNQHYIARELSSQYRVTFIESLGLRTPTFSTGDMLRVFRRLTGRRNGVEPRDVPPNLTVISPVIVPYHRGLARLLNRVLLRRATRDWSKSEARRILWTYTPLTYGHERLADSTVYHCVDLLGDVKGISASLIEREERFLAATGSTTLASSPIVKMSLSSRGFTDILLWPNVADVAAIRRAKPAIESRAHQRVVFAGNLSVEKVDFELLEAVLSAGLELHLAGPIAQGDAGRSRQAVERLVKLGAVHHGMLQMKELAELYWTARVGLIPYRLNAYTVGVSPLKTYEYLAADLAVVSTAIPSVTREVGHIEIANTPNEFLEALARVIQPPTALESKTRGELADQHNWLGRGVQARNLIEQMQPHE